MGEITGFTRTQAVFIKKKNSFIKQQPLDRFTSVLLKDEEKRCWSDETPPDSCPFFMDSYNILRESCLVFQRFHVT